MSADTNSVVQTWIFGGQFVAYSLTFWFLAKSLKAQRLANDLTNQKFIYDIKPFFTLSHPHEFPSISPRNSDHIVERYLMVLQSNIAKNFRIEVESRDFYDEKYHNRKLEIIAVGEKFDIINGDIPIWLIHAEVRIYIYIFYR